MKLKGKLITCAALVTATTGTIHFINRVVNCIDTMENLVNDSNGEYYEWRFGKIFYTKQGEGSPILLIHDLNAMSSQNEWNHIISDLSKTNTVYALDLLGCGQSDKPNLTYTNYLYVQLITDFIKHIIGEKTDVIATGDSSSFIIMSCANDKEIINKIMLVNPTSLLVLAKIPTKRSRLIKELIGLPIIGTLLYNILINKKSIEDEFYSTYYYNPHNIDENQILQYLECSQKENTHSKYLYASIKSRYTNANIMHCLNSIDNSIYIIVGDGNPEYELAANQYENQVPAIEIIDITESKYLPQLEKPQEFLEQVNILFTNEETITAE